MNAETTIKFEINVAAQKIVSQMMSYNEQLQKELEAGIKKAVDEFDFYEFSRNTVTKAIENAIKDSASWGSIRQLARTKADQIVEEYISKEMENFKIQVENQTRSANEFKKKK